MWNSALFVNNLFLDTSYGYYSLLLQVENEYSNMESQYSVSVIIPIHNTAPYLRRCIESVRNQTLKDIEIILVDNLSTDDSPSICDEYANIDSRVRVLHLDEAGLSIARNAGIEIATAPYIGFIDSDDYIEPTMYENMLSAMVQNKVYMVYCNFALNMKMAV